MSGELNHPFIGASPGKRGVEENADENQFAQHISHWWMGQWRMDERRKQLDLELAAAIVAAMREKKQQHNTTTQQHNERSN